MSTTAPFERTKPTWLKGYIAYIAAALLLCALAMVRLANEGGLFAAVVMIPTAGLCSFIAYSLLHWQVSWARQFNLGMNAVIGFVGLLYMTPIWEHLPYVVSIVYSWLVAPVVAAIAGEFLQTAPPVIASIAGLAMLGLAAYWVYCWWKFVPSAEGSVGDLESDELSRNVRSVIRKGTITLWIIGILSLIKALSDGADGNLIWSGIAALSLFVAFVAMVLTVMFPGEGSLGD